MVGLVIAHKASPTRQQICTLEQCLAEKCVAWDYRRNSTVGGREVARIDAISSESTIYFLRTLTWSNRSHALASTRGFRTRTELGNRRRREWRKVAANEPSVG